MIHFVELSSKHKQEATQYLLGTATADEQMALEEKYFSDPSFFEQVVAVEKELLDDYARDRLSVRERELFERHYLSHPKRRSRAKAATALATKLDQLKDLKVETRASSWWRNLFAGAPSRGLVFGMALATVLLAVGVAWFWLEARRLRSELDRSRMAQATIEQREKELQGLLTEQRGRNEQLTSDLEKLNSSRQQSVTPSAPAFVSLLLIAGLVRDGNSTDTPRVVIPPGTEQLRLQLKIKENNYRRYRLSVETANGEVVRTFNNLTPTSAKIFTMTLPTSLFTDGEYVLELTGLNDNGDNDRLSKSLFRVETKSRNVR